MTGDQAGELPDWPDDVLDVAAAVQAVRVDDMAALAVLLRNMNGGGCLVTAVKLLAVAAEELDVSPEYFRRWSLDAVQRSLDQYRLHSGHPIWQPMEWPRAKVCKKCGKVKHLEEFGLLSASPDGHRHWCKSCKRADDLARLKTPRGRERIRRACAAYWARHPGRAQELRRQRADAQQTSTG